MRWEKGVRIGGALVFTRLGTAEFLGPLGLAVGGIVGATLGYILSEPH